MANFQLCTALWKFQWCSQDSPHQSNPCCKKLLFIFLTIQQYTIHCNIILIAKGRKQNNMSKYQQIRCDMSIGYQEPVKRHEATVRMLIRNDNQEIFSGKKTTMLKILYTIYTHHGFPEYTYMYMSYTYRLYIQVSVFLYIII